MSNKKFDRWFGIYMVNFDQRREKYRDLYIIVYIFENVFYKTNEKILICEGGGGNI